MFMTIQWYENRFILSKELIKNRCFVKPDSTRKFVIFIFRNVGTNGVDAEWKKKNK